MSPEVKAVTLPETERLTLKEKAIQLLVISWINKGLRGGEREFDICGTDGTQDLLLYWLRTSDGQLKRIMPTVISFYEKKGWRVEDLDKDVPERIKYPHHIILSSVN